MSDTGGWDLKPYQLVYVAMQAGCWVEADAIDRLNEEAQFLLSIQGETPRDVWREQWRVCQMSRTAWFLADELSRSNPDKSLRQTINVTPTNTGTKVD